MINLDTYVKIFEGGAAGHMEKPEDISEWTCQDLIDLISDLFGGKISDITEKLDGTQIQWSMSEDGEPVFIRNKGDLAREAGGMTLQDMIDKWKDKPEVQHAFVQAGEIIKKVCDNMELSFFKPDDTTRKYVNSECIVAGKTNIMYYADDQVDFHNIWVYKLVDGKWEKSEVTKKGLDAIDRACSKVDKAKLTPKVLIRTSESSSEDSKKFQKEVLKMFTDEGLKKSDTIEDWKRKRFNDIAPEWMQGNDAFFNRWCNGDKSVNIRELKKAYPEHVDELVSIDKKGYKEYVKKIMEPMDLFWIRVGQAAIESCEGLMNDKVKGKAISQMKADLEEVVISIKTNGTVETQDMLAYQLKRIQDMAPNSTEGIVITYKGKMVKLTSVFAPLNQILGTLKYKQ